MTDKVCPFLTTEDVNNDNESAALVLIVRHIHTQTFKYANTQTHKHTSTQTHICKIMMITSPVEEGMAWIR